MKKRLISFLLLVSVLLNLFTFNMYSSTENIENTYMSPNVALLENILNGNRRFVLDTLVGDDSYVADFSTNPHAMANDISGENAMMQNVLSQYQNKNDPLYNPAYKAAVDIMEKIYNGDDYLQSVADWVTSFAADLMSVFSKDAQKVIDDLTYSASQLQYESILKEVLTADYTSSSGVSLSSTEIELETLDRFSDAVSALKDLCSAVVSYGKADHYDKEDENFKNACDYAATYLTDYSDSIDKLLDTFAELVGLEDNELAEGIFTLLRLYAVVAQYERHVEQLKMIEDKESSLFIAEFFVSAEDLKKMKLVKSAVSGVDNALSSYMFINSIATQRDDLKDTLIRMSATANPKLKPILLKFAEELGKAGDAKLVGYESLMKVLRDENAVIDFTKWGTKKISEKFGLMKKMKELGLANTALTKAISSVTAIVDITKWCADKAMNFEDTCKKTYELKYLRTIIGQTAVTYERDLAVYLADKTNDNATKVLDDLIMLQKLRMRGEKIAYEMTKGQWTSPLGKLLATGTLKEDEMLMSYLDEAYQRRIDAFIGASVIPFTTEEMKIVDGETMAVYYDSSYGGLYATYTKADGTLYGIAELEYRIANGITVENGGRLIVTEEVPHTALACITNNGGQVFLAGNVQLGEYTQKSGTTVLGEHNYSFGDVQLSSGVIRSEIGGTLSCTKMQISGTSYVEIPVNCSGAVTASGTVSLLDLAVKGVFNQTSGTLELNGAFTALSDVNFSGKVTQGDYEFRFSGDLFSNSSVSLGKLITDRKLSQTIHGNLTVRDFCNSSNKLELTSPINVTRSAKSTAAPKNGKYIIMSKTAEFDDSFFYGDVTVRGLRGNLPRIVYGNVYVEGDITQNQSLRANSITVSSGNISINNSDVTFSGACKMNGGNISLKHSDASFKSVFTSSSSSSVEFDETSTLTLYDARISGVITGKKLIVKGDLYNSGTLNIETLVLAPSIVATVNGDSFSIKDIIIEGDKTVELNARIEYNGDFVSNGMVLNESNAVYTGVFTETESKVYNSLLNISGSTLVIDNRTVECKKGLNVSNATIIIRNGGKLIVSGSSKFTGSSSNEFIIDETSSAYLRKLTTFNGIGGISVDGNLAFGSDVSLNSVKLYGNGTVELGGDMYGNSSTVLRPHTFVFNGKLQQTFYVSGAEFNNLTINNYSRHGVTFNSSVKCYGEYTTNGNTVSGTVNLQ